MKKELVNLTSNDELFQKFEIEELEQRLEMTESSGWLSPHDPRNPGFAITIDF